MSSSGSGGSQGLLSTKPPVSFKAAAVVSFHCGKELWDEEEEGVHQSPETSPSCFPSCSAGWDAETNACFSSLRHTYSLTTLRHGGLSTFWSLPELGGFLGSGQYNSSSSRPQPEPFDCGSGAARSEGSRSAVQLSQQCQEPGCSDPASAVRPDERSGVLMSVVTRWSRSSSQHLFFPHQEGGGHFPSPQPDCAAEPFQTCPWWGSRLEGSRCRTPGPRRCFLWRGW